MTAPTVPGPATTQRRPDRHRDEYWDVFSAGWRRRTPAVPTPRSGD